MTGWLLNLIIQLVAGAIGGNAVGSAARNLGLGSLGNTIAGALGGAGGGTLLTSLLPFLQGAATNGQFNLGSLIGQFIGGGIAGAILTALVGLVKNAMAGEQAR